MAESSRVEELRKRYHENPRRFFAPLANEYRKAGFIDRAILLCQKHLGEQPENMNGQIVYGQALFESGRHEEARGPFGAALELDPENLIALRHLGDIGRLSGNNEDAQKWYGRVLEFDRRNDEVRELFEQVGGTLEPRSGVSAPAPRAPRVTSPTPEPPRAKTPASVDASAKTVEITPRPLASVKTAEVEARPQRRASLLDISFDFGETAADAPGSAAPAAPASPSQTQLPSRGDAEARRGGAEGGGELVPLDLSLLDDSDPTIPPVARQQPSTELSWLESPASTPGEGLPSLDSLNEPAAASLPSLDDYESSSAALPSLGDAEEAASASSATPREKTPAPASKSAMSGAFPLDAEFPLEGDLEGDYDLGESLLEPEPDVTPSAAPQAIEGLQVADFSADVAPLPDLEPSEFTPASTNIAPLPELETAEFMVPGEQTTMGSIIDFELEPAAGEAPDSPSATADSSSSATPEPSSATPGEPVSAGNSNVDLPYLDMLDVEPAAAEPTFDPTSTVPTPSTAPAIVTETMAELYLEQGFHAEAIEVYRTLIAQDPGDERLKEKLSSLEGARASLEFATPTTGLDDIGERAPTNAMLAEVSFDDVSSLGTPKTPSAGTGRAPTPRDKPSVRPAAGGTAGEGTGPTAREFFAAFVHRKVTTARAGDVSPVAASEAAEHEPANWAVPATESPLDALFGNAVPDVDQRAANRLAGIGTTSAPSGGSMLDTLFAVDTGEIVEAPSVGVPRASQKLRFDQFFSSTSTPPEPRTAEPGPVDESSQEQAGSEKPAFAELPQDVREQESFEQTLQAASEEAAPGHASSEPSAPQSPRADDQSPDSDDLDRFHGWLKGLTE